MIFLSIEIRMGKQTQGKHSVMILEKGYTNNKKVIKVKWPIKLFMQ
jgi:hypothetical protein